MEPQDQSDQLSAAILSYMDRVEYFSRMQFFQSFKETDLVEKTSKILQKVSLTWDTLDVLSCADLQSSDVHLLAVDNLRVWQRDLECVLPGQKSYEETLAEWSQISRGCFSPHYVKETWDDDKYCSIKFSIGDKEYSFNHGSGDMLDMRIRKVVNAAIESSGGQFEVCDTLGMPNFVFLLTPKEKQKLQSERHWVFYNF